VRLAAFIVAAALAASPTALLAQARNADTVLMSENERYRADQERFGFSDAVVAGDTIYLSGIVAGRAPGETSLTPAFERVFRQVERILRRAGATLGDIVDMTSFHTDIVPEVEAMSEVQKRLLGSPPPAWTAIQVERLLPENGIAEIKIVARRSGAAPVPQGRN
jgi:enamine deaminase RidA (YjgF/YER057c/UK114 family)